MTTGADPTAALLDDDTFRNDPQHLYEALRRHGITWNAQLGFWAVPTHDGVTAVSADAETFCSGRGIILPEIGVEYPAPPTIMHTDPPAHGRYRKLVQPAFAPKRIRAMEESVRGRAERLVAALPDGESVEIVQGLTAPLPLQVITDLLGIDDAQHERFLIWSDAAIPGAGDFTDEERSAHLGDMVGFLLETAAQRRADPRDDLVSTLATVTIDGDSLDDGEIAMFLVQLLVAGNETTRHALTGGLLALGERPEQWAQLRADRSLLSTVVEEILRWTTPVIAFMRTATVDTTVSGTPVRADDPLLLLYAAANRDPAEFGPTADDFDLRRAPNHHVAFGFGPHFCIGAALARLEIRTVIEALLDRFTTIDVVAQPTRSGSNVIAGIRSLDLRFHT